MGDIFTLAAQNKAEELRSLFVKGIGSKAADEHGKTLLHHAAGVNAVAVIDLLLERGVSLDAKDATGLTPIMHAAKKRCEDGVITLIERGADSNSKLPDGSWLSDWFSKDTFPARVATARQLYAARSTVKGNNLLLSILTASSTSTGGHSGANSNITSPTSNGLLSSSSSGSLASPTSPSSLESPSSGIYGAAAPSPLKTNTLRRSTITLKAVAEKDSVMSAEPSKDVKSPLTAPNPKLSNTPHSRRGSIGYATVRPRNTISTAEGAALREAVAVQMSNRNLAPTTTSNAANSSSAPPAAEQAAPNVIDPSAGSTVSSAFAASSSKKDKKSDAKKDKKDKKEKKEKEKKAKKSDSPTTPSKRDAKKEFRRKQEEDEAAKAEARAEKTQKRKTLSIFGKSSKESKSSEKASSSSSKAKTAPTSALAQAVDSSAASSSAPNAAAPSAVAASSQPQTPSITPSASSVSIPDSSSAGQDNTALVDELPEGAVALGNGDFLIGVEADAVNLEALTDAMAKVLREATSPLLGTPNFEIKALLEATKVLSTTLKSIMNVSEFYAQTLETPEAGAEFKKVTEALRTETARSLVLAIKAVTVNSTDTEPLKKAMIELSVNVSRLYKCVEFPTATVVVENLQGVVSILRSLVSIARVETAKETFQHECSAAVITTMRLCSLVQDFGFASCKSVRNQRSLTDSAFALAQSLRGLVMAASGLQVDAKSETHANALAQMLKTAAEYVRAISRTLREEESFIANPRLAQENDHMLEPAPQDVVIAYLRKGCGLMANAKDKYVAKSTVGLANDEKQVLSLVVSQAQLVATLMEALPQHDMTRVTQTAVSIGASMSSLQRLLQPLLDTCLDQDLIEETVTCLENIIRCGIQVKILCCLVASHTSSSEYRLQLSQMCQLWGIYTVLLLDAVYRALHLV